MHIIINMYINNNNIDFEYKIIINIFEVKNLNIKSNING